MAISDSGATGRFLLPGTPVNNISPGTRYLLINPPYGETIKSTYTWKLEIPWLPDKAKISHIVTGLVHSSLVSIKFLCESGFKVIYQGRTCNVYFEYKLVWQGIKEPTTGLWMLPLYLTQAKLPHASPTNKPTNYTTNNVYTITSKQSLIKFLYQCLFIPPKTTLIKGAQTHGDAHDQLRAD